MIPNALTFDVEDWHQLVEWKLTGSLPPCSDHVLRQTDDILEMLASGGVTATFFILGLVARAHPQLVRRIQAAGHEIGSHGMSHRLIYRQTRDEFRLETVEARKLLEDVTGSAIAGYRAAEFSITQQSLWALDILAEVGFAYDSSIFPIAGTRYGIVDHPLTTQRRATASGDIVEVPMTAIEWRGRRWPVGGGGYFRLFPHALTRAAIRRANAQGRPAILYFHPYEFSRQLLVPRLASLGQYASGGRYVVFHNINRRRNRRRLVRLIAEGGPFVPMKEIAAHG